MTTAPYVELGFHPTDLRPRDLPQAGAYLGSPAEALEAAFSVVRAQMVAQMRDETRGLSDPTHSQLLRIADLAWQGAFYRFRKVSAPIIADAYMHAYQAANAGDVPMSLIYDLAEKHAEKVGDYFHITSREGLADGFNTLVNRQIPAKAAVDRVLDAYGLTPRQMRAYTSAKQFRTPVSDRLPRSLKAKVREYVDRSFTSRIKKMSAQEEHNIDEQAKQFAWMWLQEKGRLNEKAQKLWVTAKDERVCKVCGPLHGKKVGVNQRFRTSQGEFWTPGLHPNCRCVVRLLEHRFSKNAFGVVAKAEWNPKEHPRGGDRENRGRFSRVAERQQPVISTPVIEPAEETEEPEEAEVGRVSFKPSEGVAMREGKGSFKPGGATWTPSGATWKPSAEATWKPSEDAKERMTPSEREEALASMITPKMRMVLDRTTMHMVNALEAYQKPERPGRESIIRQVLRIQDDAGHEYPVYGVVKPGKLNWDEEMGKVELTHNIYFTPSKSRAIAEAEEAFNEQQLDAMDRIKNSDRGDLKVPRHGRQWRANLDETDVSQVVAWAAYTSRTADPDVFFDDTLEIEFADQGSNRTTLEMPFSELARHLGVSPSEFDVRILRMDEGHDSRDGTTVMLNAGTRGGYEDWVTSGVYKANEIRTEDVGHNVALKVYFIDPDAKEHRIPFD